MFNIDNIIIGIFLLFTVLLGIVSSKKIKTIKDYAIANKTYSTIPLLLTMIATMIGGDDTTGDVVEFFSNGIIYALPYMGFIISLIIIGRYIAPRFDKRFEGMISVSDMMQSFYGEKVAIASGVVGTIVTLGAASVQSIALGRLVSACMGLDYKMSVMIGSGIVVFYTMLGGIRSVVVTDIFQFCVLVVMIPIICSVPIAHIGGIFELIHRIPSSHVSIFSNKNFYEYVALFFVWAMPINVLFPTMIQRFLMCNNTKQITYIMYIYAAILFLLLLIIMCLSFSMLIIHPEINTKEIVPSIINNLIPQGIRGLAIIGVMAAIMSTLDSNLNSASILFTHNVLLKGNLESLKIIKVSTFVLGVTQMLVAFLDLDIVNVVVFTQSVLAVGIGIPLCGGIMRIKATPLDFWLCICCSILGLLTSAIYLREINYISSLITILCGGAGFLTSICLKIDKSKFTTHSVVEIVKVSLASSALIVRHFIRKASKAFNFVEASNESIRQHGANYMMFGIFSCINYIVPYFMWPHQINNNYGILLALRITAGTLSVSLLLKEYWFRYLEKYFGLYWFITLLSTLVLVPTVMFILNNSTFEWLLNLSLAVFILALLVEWQAFIILLVMGSTLGYITCSLIEQDVIVFSSLPHLYLGIYLFVFAVLIGITFSRQREITVRDKVSFLKLCGGLMAHELKTPLAQLAISTRTLEKIHHMSDVKITKGKYQVTYDKKSFDAFIKKLGQHREYITDGSDMIENLSLAMQTTMLSKEKIQCSIATMIDKALLILPLEKKYKARIFFNQDGDINVKANKKYITHTITNIILNAYKHAFLLSDKSKLYINLKNDSISFKDTGPGIPQEILPRIFEPYFSSNKTNIGLGLTFCKLVIEDMGGSINCYSKFGEYTEFIIIFPIESGLCI